MIQQNGGVNQVKVETLLTQLKGTISYWFKICPYLSKSYNFVGSLPAATQAGGSEAIIKQIVGFTQERARDRDSN